LKGWVVNMKQRLPILMGIISLLLIVELYGSLLVGFRSRCYQLGAAYIRWKAPPPTAEYLLVTPQRLPEFGPVTMEMLNTTHPRQQWVLWDKQGRVSRLEVQQIHGRLLLAGWHRYSFTILQWQVFEVHGTITFVQGYRMTPVTYLLFFYDTSRQELGYAVLYWKS
jgi:hypothetical protein